MTRLLVDTILDQFQDLIEAEREVVDAYNSETFDPSKFYSEDCMLMPVGKDVIKSVEGTPLLNFSVYIVPNT